jgi:hypothetical protein
MRPRLYLMYRDNYALFLMYGFAPGFYVAQVMLLAVNALLYFMFLCSPSFWTLPLLPFRKACWRILYFLLEDIVCFLVSVSL